MSTRQRRRLDALDRREQILSCAVRLFEQRPYENVSLTAIAEEAGVARPLLNHYFGGKRELYLEVVRRLTQLPPLALGGLPLASLEETVGAVADHWLSVVARNRRMWLTAANFGGPGADPEVQRVIEEGLASVADRLIPALGLEDVGDRLRTRAALMAYAALAKEASRQWLVTRSIDEHDVRDLLVEGLLAVHRSISRQVVLTGA